MRDSKNKQASYFSTSRKKREYPGHPGYEISQKACKRVEEIFGWMKTIGGVFAKSK